MPRVIAHAAGLRYKLDREAAVSGAPRNHSNILNAHISLCLLFGAGAGGSDMIFPLRAADVLALAVPKRGGGSNYRIVKVFAGKHNDEKRVFS